MSAFMLYSRLVVLTILISSLFLLPFAAEAEQASQGENVFTLGEVEVADKSEKSKNVTIDKVYGEEMRLFNRDTVAEAVNLLPGVTLSRTGARNESTVYVRGFDSKHVPLYLDGIPIYVPYDGYPDLGRFYTYDLSEVIISKGFSSVLYGPNTMGGVINMVSKRPEKTFVGSMGAGVATGDTYHTYLNLGTNQKKWYIQGSLAYVDSDSFRLSNDYHKPVPTASENGGDRDNSYHRDQKASIKVAYTPNRDDEYALSYAYQHGVKGTPPYTGYDTTNRARYWRWPYWDKESLYFTSRTSLGDSSYAKLRLYHDAFKNSLNMYGNDTYATLTSDSWYDDFTIGGSVEAGTTRIPRNTLKAALHFKRDVHREESDTTPLQRFEDEIYSFGVEDTIDITKKLYVIIGASYDKLSTQEAQDLTSTTPRTTVDVAKNDSNAFNPQIGVFYALSDTGKLHAAVSKKTRFPSIKDKYSYRNGTALPNPDLKPEQSINYEIGYQDVLFRVMRLKTTFFYNDITDYILLIRLPAPDNKDQNQNIGTVEQYGFEAEIAGELMKKLEGGINYTWLDAENKTNSNKLTNIPKNKVFTYLRYTPVRKLSLLGSLEYDSSRFSSTNGVRVASAFAVFNAKALFEITRGAIAEAGVSNLFDKNYALDEGFPEPGRTFFVNVRYSF